MKKAILTSLISACIIFPTVYLTACNKNNDVTVETKSTVVQGKTMGTFYQVNVVGGYKGGEDGLKALAEGAFAKITKAISTFDKDAELYKFNDFKSTEPFKISDDLSVMIQNTVYQGRRIEGATDISVGPLVNLWGFGKDKKDGNKPSQEQIEETLKLVGQDKFELLLKEDGAYLVKHDPNVRLDLATVGEGLGADFVAELLIKEGYQNFMVNVAGASRSYGK
ncbi:MAG: FAD:protein FMN transferase, partial [Succinivibrio sp.]|nr:FAD:protein FMN transferase [Succinivibrio sp.]